MCPSTRDTRAPPVDAALSQQITAGSEEIKTKGIRGRKEGGRDWTEVKRARSTSLR